MSILTGERVYTVKDSPDLIAQCLAGDETAVADLYRLFAADVYRLVYGLLGHREDAEEVMQDTFVYAIRNLSRFNPERASFRTWLFVIATSRARNKRRRRLLPTISLRQLLQLGVEPPAQDDSQRPPETQLEDAHRHRAVREALDRLSPKLREAAVLRYFEGLTYKEIGQILDIPHKTAESRVRLAHKALRDLMADPDTAPEFTIALWYPDYPTADSYLTPVFGPLETSWQNWAYYDNDEVNQLLEEARFEFDEATRTEIYEEIQSILIEDAPCVYMIEEDRLTFLQPYVEGYHRVPNHQAYAIYKMSAEGKYPPEEPEPEPEPKWIPGFPYESVLFGVLSGAALVWYLSKNK